MEKMTKMPEAEVKTITREELMKLNGALVFMPDNVRVRLGMVVVSFGSIHIQETTNRIGYIAESEELYRGEAETYRVAVLAK